MYTPIEQGGLGVRNVTAQINVFRLPLIRSIVCGAHNTYFMSNLAERVISMIVEGKSCSSNAFIESVDQCVRKLKIRVHQMPQNIFSRILVTNENYVKPVQCKILRDCGVQNLAHVFSQDSIEKTIEDLQAFKIRSLVKVLKELSECLSSVVKSSDETPILFAFCSINRFFMEVTCENDYLISLASGNNYFSSEDIKKIKAFDWKLVKKSKTLKEAEIIWRFRHSALLSPELAFHMHLVDEKKCPMCLGNYGSSRHYIVCNTSKPLWEYVKRLCEIAGCKWKPIYRHKGICEPKWKCLNHLVSLVYTVIYNYVVCKFNGLPHNGELLVKFKQSVFELLYVEFSKAKSCGATEVERLKVYWEPLSYVFRVMGSCIDIRLPSFP